MSIIAVHHEANITARRSDEVSNGGTHGWRKNKMLSLPHNGDVEA